ncbi:MAG: hypothetical protein Q9218_001508 [Villophora microphyllina]
MPDNGQGPSQASIAPAAEPNDTVYYVTAQTNALSKRKMTYKSLFGPSRSRTDASQALCGLFPQARALIGNLGGLSGFDWTLRDRLRWTESNGDEVVVRLEQDNNPSVCASGPEQVLWTVFHWITNHRCEPVFEKAEIVGTFLTVREAARASQDATWRDVETIIDKNIEVDPEMLTKDGTIGFTMQNIGGGGLRWMTEIKACDWQ